MDYVEIDDQGFAVFHRLMEAYYRDGEDANTPQHELDQFIQMLFGMILDHQIKGCLAKNNGVIVGFVLWAIDTDALPFSEIPGNGTILEIGVLPAFRSAGFGAQLVSHAEQQMLSDGISQCYVSAYGPAQAFWSKCGYAPNGSFAGNGLPIMTKAMAGASQ